MLRKTSLFLMLLLTAATMWAVPAKPGITRRITLADGTTQIARLVGDEHGHFWLGQDGQAYQQQEDAVVYRAVNRNALIQKAQQRRNAVNQRRTRRLAPRRVGQTSNYIGDKKGLIILVNFSNSSFKSANNNALYNRIANEKNFSDGNFIGSMHDYFLAQSYGQFNLTFDVVGPVTVSKASSYYGKNDSNGDDMYPATMVIEALKLVDNQVNFKDYDWDGDGEVDQVYVVYAGKGEADGGAANTIWPHEWTLDEAAEYGDGDGVQRLDGVRINTYACGPELDGYTGSIAGIGTMCHEFSHCLGYPDFYDIDYSGGQGMFEWDLMDTGSYNGDGFCPAAYTSYERWVAGWTEPVELTEDLTVSNMKAITDGGESYIIYNPGNRNEYFLLENRQQEGWDAGIPGSGLLILHVDYDTDVWASNTPNDDPSHQRMTWIAADNNYQYERMNGTKYYTTSGAANDPFPYGSVNAFGPQTTPAAKFYNKNTNGSYLMDATVGQITQNANGTMSFVFNASGAVTPVPVPSGDGDYVLVTDASTLADGDELLIAYVDDGTALAMSTTQNTNNRGTVEVTLHEDGSITANDEAQVITLEQKGTEYLFNVGSGYLYAASSSKNWLRTQTTADANSQATISISGGDATIIFQGSNSRNELRYNPNNGNPIFSCYGSTSSVISLPQLYRKVVTPAIALQNAADNTALIAENDGVTANITLSGRTFYKDGEWNTLCLPFSIADFTGTPLDGATVMELDVQTTRFDAATGAMTIHFSPVNTITAGKPYVVKWTVPGATEMQDPVFSGVTIEGAEPAGVSTADGYLTFLGTFNPIVIPSEGDNTKLFMHTGSTLYYPSGAMTINPFHAFFQLNGISAGDATGDVRSFHLTFGDEEVTSIHQPPFTIHTDGTGAWYSLDGRRLSHQPATKGIYICNGKKVIK
ncbi:MAG: M6 family metalloprotease domain-containing protein [Bacteroidaceae bacterium]|nr:M6 family metalloprotease domain-containing protein [Bacteroidaceae bacterium]